MKYLYGGITKIVFKKQEDLNKFKELNVLDDEFITLDETIDEEIFELVWNSEIGLCNDCNKCSSDCKKCSDDCKPVTKYEKNDYDCINPNEE